MEIYISLGDRQKAENQPKPKKNDLKIKVKSYKWMMLSLIDISYVQV